MYHTQELTMLEFKRVIVGIVHKFRAAAYLSEMQFYSNQASIHSIQAAYF